MYLHRNLVNVAWRWRICSSPARRYGTCTLEDDMSVTHARLLSAALESHLPRQLPSNIDRGSKLPEGWHLVYFNHAVSEPQLGADGYDNLQAPSAHGSPALVRRWLGGRLEFNNDNQLRLGDNAICTENVHDSSNLQSEKHRYRINISREIKRSKESSDYSIKEMRTLYYFEASRSMLKRMSRLISGRPVSDELHAAGKDGLHELEVTLSQMLLFRYSALSFNAHMIHYDPVYAKEIEGLSNIVAQGPLMVTMLLTWFKSAVCPPYLNIKSMEYQNLGSVFADEKVRLVAMPSTKDGEWHAWIVRGSRSGDDAEKAVFAADISLT